jgi:hypothetical protein
VAVVATVVGVSAAVLLSGQTTPALAAAAPGSTVRASVVDGTNAQSPEGGWDQELSADGTAVTFVSEARLDDLDNGGYNSVYVRDLRNKRTVLISRGQFTRPDTGGGDVPSNPGLAGDPLLSLNGRRAQPNVEFGETAPNGYSAQPTISGDGRYVAFSTNANNIAVEDDDTDTDLLVCDRDPDGDGEFDEEVDGVRQYRYFRVSQPRYEQGGSAVYRIDRPGTPKLSDDASRLVYEDLDIQGESYAETVMTAVLRVPGGGVGPGPVSRVLTPLGESQPTAQFAPDVSADGRFVVLAAEFERAVGGGEFPTYIPFDTILRKDLETEAVVRVDWDVNTTPENIEYLSADQTVELFSPVMSGNGDAIAFVAEEYQSNCENGCWNTVADQPVVYVVRLLPDGTPVDSIIASRDNDNEIVNGLHPALSGDGRFVAFGTDNLDAHDGVDAPSSENQSCLTYNPGFAAKPLINLNGVPPTSDARDDRTSCQIVVRDLVTDRERLRNEEPRLPGTLVSAGPECDGGTCVGDSDSPSYRFSSPPSLSYNGSTVAFESWATNLVSGEVDDNEAIDVFVRTFRPELRADPNPLEFGEVEIDDTFTQTVRFDHVGTGPLVVTEIVADGDYVVGAQTCGGEAVVLQQSSSCEVSVSFTPTAAGAREGTLTVRTRDGREFTVPLRGVGTEEPVPPDPDAARFAAAPDPLAFGDRLLLSTNPAQVVTVSNLGGTPLTVTSVQVISALAPNDYAVAADTCTGVPVAPAATCTVSVVFSPTAPLARPAVLRFLDDAPGGQAHLVGLTGSAGAPKVEVSPAVTQPGRVINVIGTGFAPNRAVSITMTDSVEKETVITDAAGGFSKPVLILPGAYIGTRQLVATVDTFPTITAQKPLLIVTPSVGPADFVLRN